MTALLVDIGNTRIKWGFVQSSQAELQQTGALNYQTYPENLKQQLIEYWGQIPNFSKAWLCCVGDSKIKDLVVKSIQESGCEDIQTLSSQDKAYGVVNGYLQTEQLGADRWAALLAAHHLYPGDLLIVNCGTAITIDFLQDDGHHKGGYILPGMELMKNSLFQGTRDLPEVKLEGELPALNFYPANNTQDAIHDGVILSVVAIIEKVIRQTQSLGFKDVQCLLTGGSADTVMANLNLLYHYEPNLVLKGLALASDS